MSKLKILFTAITAILVVLVFECTTVFADNPAAEEHYNKGFALYDEGHYTDAVKEFTAAIELDGSQERYYDGRGWSYNYSDNYIDAEKDFNKALELKEDYPYAYRGRGYARHYLDNDDAALADLKKAISLKEDYVGAYEDLAMVYIAQKNLQEASANYAKAGSFNINEKKYEKALADYNAAIILDENNAENYFYRGVAYANLENHSDDAIKDFLKAGQLFLDAQKYDEAQGSFGEVIELVEKSEDRDSVDKKALWAEACSLRAKAYKELGDNVNAKNFFNYASVVYDEIGNYDAAIENVTEAIKINPEALFYANRGVTYKKRGYLEKAIEDFTSSIEKDPIYIWAYRLRADTYFELPDYYKALEDYQKLIKLNETQNILNEDEIEDYQRKIKICIDAPDPDNGWFKRFIATVQSLFGELDLILQIWIAVTIIEYILGICCEKKAGTLTATTAIQALVVKFIFAVIIVAVHAIEQSLTSIKIRDFFIALVLVYELLSLLEKAGELGLPIPDWLPNFLKTIRDKIKNILGMNTT